VEARVTNLGWGKGPAPGVEVWVKLTGFASTPPGSTATLLDAGARAEYVKGDKRFLLGHYPCVEYSSQEQVKFDLGFGYRGMEIIEANRHDGDAELGVLVYARYMVLRPGEGGALAVMHVGQEIAWASLLEGYSTVKIAKSDWEEQYLPHWGENVLVVSIRDPILLDSIYKESNALAVEPGILAQDIIRRRYSQKRLNEPESPP
jgi:hypothetical protein